MAGDDSEFPLTIAFDDSVDGRVVASIPGIPGAIGAGQTREEARESAMGALRALLDSRRKAAG